MKISFSMKTPLFTVSEDDPTKVSVSVRLQSDLGEGPRDIGHIGFTHDLGEAVAPEVFQPLHCEPVAEGRGQVGRVEPTGNSI